jgi:hypothetical protein
VRYKIKTPSEVQAFCYGKEPYPDWFKRCIEQGWAIPYQTGATIRTTYSQVAYVIEGDWIVQGYNGIPFGVPADDFERQYEPCE